MKINKTNVLRGVCVIGYGVFIVTALLQSVEAPINAAILTECGRVGLAFGSATMFMYMLNRDGKLCELKNRMKDAFRK